MLTGQPLKTRIDDFVFLRKHKAMRVSAIYKIAIFDGKRIDLWHPLPVSAGRRVVGAIPGFLRNIIPDFDLLMNDFRPSQFRFKGECLTNKVFIGMVDNKLRQLASIKLISASPTASLGSIFAASSGDTGSPLTEIIISVNDMFLGIDFHGARFRQFHLLTIPNAFVNNPRAHKRMFAIPIVLASRQRKAKCKDKKILVSFNMTASCSPL